MKLKVIILEDNEQHRIILEKKLNSSAYFKVIGTFSTFQRYHQFVLGHSVDIAFLDIELEEENVIEKLKFGAKSCEVVFTTSHSGYALKGYDYEPLHYLMKPISECHVLEVVQRWHNRHKHIQEEQDVFFVMTGRGKLERLKPSQILYVQAFGDYVKIVTDSGIMTSYLTLKEFLNQAPEGFEQVHRSYLINLTGIDRIEDDQIFVGNDWIPISNSFRKDFLKAIDLLTIRRS